MTTRIILAALFTLTGTVVPMRCAAADMAQLSAASADPCTGQAADLERGKLVFIATEPENGKGVALHACGLIDEPPAAVWAVLRDCGKYDQFLPRVEHSALLARVGNVATCEGKIDLPFPLGSLSSVTRVVETRRPDGGFQRRWTLVRGGYEHNDGSWTLVPWGPGGQRTLAIYRIDMDPKTIVPDFLLRRIQTTTAHKVFDAIRARVRACSDAKTSDACSAPSKPTGAAPRG
jgi:ribosome-associated toxin RatA of RatAB toxin-antitoxin module